MQLPLNTARAIGSPQALRAAAWGSTRVTAVALVGGEVERRLRKRRKCSALPAHAITLKLFRLLRATRLVVCSRQRGRSTCAEFESERCSASGWLQPWQRVPPRRPRTNTMHLVASYRQRSHQGQTTAGKPEPASIVQAIECVTTLRLAHPEHVRHRHQHHHRRPSIIHVRLRTCFI